MTHQLTSLANLIRGSRNTYVFTGAGMSTESGIPDFRSPDGIWAKYQPVYFDDFVSRQSARHEYWRQKSAVHSEFADAQPNQGHRVLADWEHQGRLNGVVTQNIDGLHQLAGSNAVLELHGTAREAVCLSCQGRFPIAPLVADFLRTDAPPECQQCGGLLKHATISFGQPLDPHVLLTAQQWMQTAELVLALGSSLVVHPAASLPQLAVGAGAQLVIVNRDPTPLDHLASIVIHSSLGVTLAGVDQEL